MKVSMFRIYHTLTFETYDTFGCCEYIQDNIHTLLDISFLQNVYIVSTFE